jgi:hypothetical protein
MTSYTSTIARLQHDIADLQKKDAAEAKKEADLISKSNRAREDAERSRNPSTASSKRKDVERATQDIARVLSTRADTGSKIAAKTKELHSYNERQSAEDERSRKKLADEQKKLIREREDHERRMSSLISSARPVFRAALTTVFETKTFDFFISHASEDKDDFVRDLANELKSLGAEVFYDEYTLKVGDSLRRNIDRGLGSCKFGVVVLSEHFFRKEWPNKELDGLLAQEVEGRTRILPIWHKVSKDEVAKYSPTLADKIALNTSLQSAHEIAKELFSLLEV